MKHKVRRIHFVGSERAQSRSLLLCAATRPAAAPADTDEAPYEA
jgi:hypothetical protein